MAKRKPYQRKQDFKKKGEEIGLKGAKLIQQADDFGEKTFIHLLGAVPFVGDDVANIVKIISDSPLRDVDKLKRNAVTNVAGKILGNYWGSVLHHVTRPMYGLFDKRKPKGGDA